jgi:hypothetical protein
MTETQWITLGNKIAAWALVATVAVVFFACVYWVAEGMWGVVKWLIWG